MNEVLISWSSVGLDEVGQKEEEGGLSFPRYPFFAFLVVLSSLSLPRCPFGIRLTALSILSFLRIGVMTSSKGLLILKKLISLRIAQAEASMNEVLISWSSVGLDGGGQKRLRRAVLSSLSFSRCPFLAILPSSPHYPFIPFLSSHTGHYLFKRAIDS